MTALEFHVDLRPRLLGSVAPLDEAVECRPHPKKNQYDNSDDNDQYQHWKTSLLLRELDSEMNWIRFRCPPPPDTARRGTMNTCGRDSARGPAEEGTRGGRQLHSRGR